jgi:hypothetical protein
MRFSSAAYRARQFLLALRAQPLTADELALARSILTPDQMNLFLQMQFSEQRHALNVLRTLQGWGESDPDLLTAALLHDVGKIRAPLRLWERVLIVLGQTFAPRRVSAWGDAPPRGWRRPFVVAERHPAWGGELASEAGTSPRAVSLILHHQSTEPAQMGDSTEARLLQILQEADHQN